MERISRLDPNCSWRRISWGLRSLPPDSAWLTGWPTRSALASVHRTVWRWQSCSTGYSPSTFRFGPKSTRGSRSHSESATPAQDERTNAAALVAAVRDLAREVGMPGSLRELGLEERLLAQIVQDALDDEVMANTPRTPTEEEMLRLLESAL